MALTCFILKCWDPKPCLPWIVQDTSFDEGLACDFFPCNFCRGFCIRSSLLSPGLPENLLLREGRWKNRNWKKLVWTRIANAYQNFLSREGLANSSFCMLIIPCDSVDKQYQSCIVSEDDLQTGRQWASKRLLNQWNVLLEFSLTYYEQIGWIENGIIHLAISCVWFLQILANVGILQRRSHTYWNWDNPTNDLSGFVSVDFRHPIFSVSPRQYDLFKHQRQHTHRASSCVTPLKGQWNLQGLLYLLNPWECHGPRLKRW